MRHIADSSTMTSRSPARLLRAARFGAVALGIGLVFAGNAARAQDDDDDKTFEEKLIGGLMRGIGATNMDNAGIDYRERSPLVVPPKIDLPPPEAASADAVAPNWPKDPDVQRRKEAKAAAAKPLPSHYEQSRPLTPSELNAVRSDPKQVNNGDSAQPGNQQTNPMMSPSQLGFSGSLWNVFGGSKTETAPFTGEPTRETLTQPPSGYQTPSPNYAYGTGPKESLNNKRIDVMTGKETSN
ncbi:hypothetical protein [Rhodopseudomonas sp. B29]|uniref:hypothetical protein n=1 Tax=Rhodopseudomonas sp. B29 TaxID=95607 RepID=UPI0006878F5A|nr:hypothetical protein [Rhodopseudomonas sp. B29]